MNTTLVFLHHGLFWRVASDPYLISTHINLETNTQDWVMVVLLDTLLLDLRYTLRTRN